MIEHHDNFPIAILEKYSYYIIVQYPVVVDEETNVVSYSYPRTFHHKFLVIDYKPPPEEQSKAGDNEKNAAADTNVSDGEEEMTLETEEIEKCAWKLRPGDIIRYHEPGQIMRPEWERLSVVLSTTPDTYPLIKITNNVVMPDYQLVKVVGFMKDDSEANTA